MKATGIVRRIDDLGRVVIPKEIRITLHIKEGDPLEIYIDERGICLRKYDPVVGEDWEKIKNIIKHVLTNGFKLTDVFGDVKAEDGLMSAVKDNLKSVEIRDVHETYAHLIVEKDVYTDDEIAVAVKIAKEILLN